MRCMKESTIFSDQKDKVTKDFFIALSDGEYIWQGIAWTVYCSYLKGNNQKHRIEVYLMCCCGMYMHVTCVS